MEVKLTQEDIPEILRYLAYKDQYLDEELKKQVLDCMEKVNKAAEPKEIYKVFKMEKGNIPKELYFLTGEEIKKHLNGCNEIIIMAATLGVKVEKVMMREQIKNMSNALIMDSCASVLIEAVCDTFESKIRKNILKESKFLTTRFSPGYGDLPIEIQKEFCDALNATKTIGLTVSESGIMIPRKSVTAVLGISDYPVKKNKRTCNECNLKGSCRFRKNGVGCSE